jgi:tyrosyl-tRNA synthetase
MTHPIDKAILQRGVSQILPPNGLEEKLKKSQLLHQPLVIKLGFDPTAPDLHLGHAVVLKKLAQFQEAGHKIVIIIGDFTARIGDPTGRNKTRPPLSEVDINANAQTYIQQLSKILDINRLEIRKNSEWLGQMHLTEALRLLSQTTVAQLLTREDFSNRYQNSVPIGLHELVYPLLQGYDSVAIQSDVELGGTDQLFNCSMGRLLQEQQSLLGQIVLTMPLLVGLDGKDKMSKSKNNYIGLTDHPHEMYGKAMSIPDTLLENYLNLVTSFDVPTIEEYLQQLRHQTIHPMELKKKIAYNTVAQYHSLQAADAAQDYFYQQFQQKNEDQKHYVVIDLNINDADGRIKTVLDVCFEVQPHLSRSQLRRLIEEGAVSINGQKVTQAIAPFEIQDALLKIGKRGFFSLKVRSCR